MLFVDTHYAILHQHTLLWSDLLRYFFRTKTVLPIFSYFFHTYLTFIYYAVIIYRYQNHSLLLSIVIQQCPWRLLKCWGLFAPMLNEPVSCFCHFLCLHFICLPSFSLSGCFPAPGRMRSLAAQCTERKRKQNLTFRSQNSLNTESEIIVHQTCFVSLIYLPRYLIWQT